MKLSQLDFPVVVSHRGYNVQYPENTMSAFQAAVELGAKMIELDVSFSKDRQLVVIHDDTLNRTTNGSGLVADFSVKELQKLDAGSWYNSKFADEKIETLESVLDQVGEDVVINVEIKEESFEPNPMSNPIELEVLKLIQKKNLVGSILISSFEIRFLERLANLKNVPALAFLSRHPLTDETIEKCKTLGVYSWNPWFEILTKEQVEKAHEAGLKVFAFTVNEDKDFHNTIEMGVDGVFSDDFLKLEKLVNSAD